eukprot:257935-Rhodomonas_salina.1
MGCSARRRRARTSRCSSPPSSATTTMPSSLPLTTRRQLRLPTSSTAATTERTGSIRGTSGRPRRPRSQPAGAGKQARQEPGRYTELSLQAQRHRHHQPRQLML